MQNISSYHHGAIIRHYRLHGKMSVAKLAELWPGGPVDPRYVQKVEAGTKHIRDQCLLRQIASVLNIPLYEMGLSDYDPFHPESLPGKSAFIDSETLDLLMQSLQHLWSLRQMAPIRSIQKKADQLHHTIEQLLQKTPPQGKLEPRFFRLYADAYCLRATLQVEQRNYKQALILYHRMYELAQEVNEPATIAHALMNIGVELARSERRQDAVVHLAKARDYALDANPAWIALVNAYLSRIYADIQDTRRFHQASETAERFAGHLSHPFDDEDGVFYTLSGVLAERSAGYLATSQPQKVLDMKEEISWQIQTDRNNRLAMWIPLDWANALLLLEQAEESTVYGRAFAKNALEMQSLQALDHAYRYISQLDHTYHDVQQVRDLREEYIQLICQNLTERET